MFEKIARVWLLLGIFDHAMLLKREIKGLVAHGMQWEFGMRWFVTTPVRHA